MELFLITKWNYGATPVLRASPLPSPVITWIMKKGIYESKVAQYERHAGYLSIGFYAYIASCMYLLCWKI